MKPETGPKIPIPGAAGACIYASLQSLAMLCGEGSITITKHRAPSGGYHYGISGISTPLKQEAGDNHV